MAWFTEPRDGAPTTPERCTRCGARVGTSQLLFTAASDEPLPARGRTAWLCNQCRAEVQRDASDN